MGKECSAKRDVFNELQQVLSEHNVCDDCKFNVVLLMLQCLVVKELKKDGVTPAVQSIGIACSNLANVLHYDKSPEKLATEIIADWGKMESRAAGKRK